MLCWRNYSCWTYLKETFHINRACQLTTRATVSGIYFEYSRKCCGSTIELIRSLPFRFLCVYNCINHVCQQVMKHVKNICLFIAINTTCLKYEKILIFWWHKFHKLLNKILQNYEDIDIKMMAVWQLMHLGKWCAVTNCTSCAQVHVLPQSHCFDNREGTLFLRLHI